MSFDVIKTWDERLAIKISVALQFVAAVRRGEESFFHLSLRSPTNKIKKRI